MPAFNATHKIGRMPPSLLVRIWRWLLSLLALLLTRIGLKKLADKLRAPLETGQNPHHLPLVAYFNPTPADHGDRKLTDLEVHETPAQPSRDDVAAQTRAEPVSDAPTLIAAVRHTAQLLSRQEHAERREQRLALFLERIAAAAAARNSIDYQALRERLDRAFGRTGARSPFSSPDLVDRLSKLLGRPATLHEISLATELMRRSGVLDQLDRHIISGNHHPAIQNPLSRTPYEIAHDRAKDLGAKPDVRPALISDTQPSPVSYMPASHSELHADAEAQALIDHDNPLHTPMQAQVAAPIVDEQVPAPQDQGTPPVRRKSVHIEAPLQTPASAADQPIISNETLDAHARASKHPPSESTHPAGNQAAPQGQPNDARIEPATQTEAPGPRLEAEPPKETAASSVPSSVPPPGKPARLTRTPDATQGDNHAANGATRVQPQKPARKPGLSHEEIVTMVAARKAQIPSTRIQSRRKSDGPVLE